MKTVKELFESIVNNDFFNEEEYNLLKEKPKEVKKYIIKLLTDFNVNKISYLDKYKNKKRYLFPIILAAELKFEEVFPLLLNSFSVSTVDSYTLYEDLTADIPSILYNTFDGDNKILETFINNNVIDEQIRNYALMVYFKLTFDKRINKRVFNNFINKKLSVLQEPITDENVTILTEICNYSAEMHIYSNLLLVRKIAYSDYFDETIGGDFEHLIDKMFTYDNTNYISKIVENYNTIERCYLYRLFSFDNSIDLIDNEISPKELQKKEMLTKYISECTKTKPKDINKNDLCFCGSNLKYKKCCFGKKDIAYVYRRLEDFYDLLIDYPEVNNVDKVNKGLISFYSTDAIKMDKFFYKALHKVNVPSYIPHDYTDENFLKASYLLEGLNVAKDIIRINKVYNEDEFNEKFMIHYDIFFCLNETYRIIHDEHYPLPQLNEKIKDMIYIINKYFKGTAD